MWTYLAEAVRRKDPVVVSTRRVHTALAPGHAYALMDCRSSADYFAEGPARLTISRAAAAVERVDARGALLDLID